MTLGPRKTQAALAVLLLFLIVLPLVVRARFFQHTLIMVVFYALLGEAWNIITGYAGLISIGQAAFFGVGAYVSTFAFVKWGLNPWLGTLLSGLVTMVFGVAVGLPVTRLKGRYFAIATIALSQTMKVVFENWQYVGAARGIVHPIRDEGLLNFQFHTTKLPYYYIILAMLVLTLIGMYLMEKSKLGYYFKAIRENEDVASGLGVNKTYYKLVAIGLSAFITGICGSFLAQYSLYVEPAYVFNHTISVTIALIAVFGGVGHLAGPLLGSALLVPLSEYSRALLGSGGRGIDLMLYGAFIVLICIFEPDGVVGLFRRRRLAPATAGGRKEWWLWKSL
ncbi:MAG: branched-chain amino acid ABC transporter permease [Betaproteobacteria bacterium]